jgi:diguanylate cyclase (GGDEF)-like protein/PAS domain S-box-containing protein
MSGAPVVRVNMTRNEVGVITSVDENVVELLGWRPDQLLGAKSSDFLHPEDQASGIAAWVGMATAPGTTGVWRGRYRTAGGTWQWVETTNTLDADTGIVSTSMTRVSVAQVNIEEELRARTELLTRLSDALPAGLFQIDAERRVMFTNDQLHVIVGVAPAATIDAQLMTLLHDDRAAVDAALSMVLAGRPVEDIEIRVGGQERSSQHVCLLSLRALTDGAGTVSGAIGLVSDVTDRVQLRRELEIRASTDQLTSCLNRAAVLDVLDQLLTVRLRARDVGAAVVYLDLDRFKSVNDRFGHAAGDRLLKAAADRLRLAVRDGDSIGRIGGDEFLVVCPHVASAEAALAIAERLASFLNHHVDVGPATVDMHASVGVAWTCEPLDGDTLIARADHAMYQSKRSQASHVTLHVLETDPTSLAASDRRSRS